MVELPSLAVDVVADDFRVPLLLLLLQAEFSVVLCVRASRVMNLSFLVCELVLLVAELKVVHVAHV